MTGTSPAPAPAVQLTIVRGKPPGKVIVVTGPSFTIGRDESCQLRPHSELVSRRHAELTITPDAVLIRDLGSRNRTLVNRRELTGPTPLRDGDQIQIGPLVFAVSIRGARPAAAGRPRPRPPLDDLVASWLISDEESEAPEHLSAVYSGDTRVSADEAAPEGDAPHSSPTQAAPEDAKDAAYDLLREMIDPESEEP